MAEAMELKIYSKEDRLKVAAILIDNGYTVSQSFRCEDRGADGKGGCAVWTGKVILY